MPKKSPLDWLGVLPMATLLAVVFSVATGIVNLVDPHKLSFEDYLAQVVAVWGFVAVGRGFAVTKSTVTENPFVRFVNSFPWATVVAIIVGVVGYVDVIVNSDGSLDWQEYGTRMAFLIGALGVGRGVGALQKRNAAVLEPVDDANDLELVEDDKGIEEPAGFKKGV